MKKVTFYKAMYNIERGHYFEPAQGWQETYTAANGDSVTVIYHHEPGGRYWQATEKTTGFAICRDQKTRAAAVEFVTGENPVQILRAVNVRPWLTPEKSPGILDRLADRLRYCEKEKARLAAHVASPAEEVPACIS